MEEEEERIEVKKIKFLPSDPYFNNVIVKLTTGEKFLVLGEIDEFGRFYVKQKRGSIFPYFGEMETDEEQDEVFDYYLKKNRIEIKTMNSFEYYLLEENYESAIANAIILHGDECIFNHDPIVDFMDYSLKQ